MGEVPLVAGCDEGVVREEQQGKIRVTLHVLFKGANTLDQGSQSYLWTSRLLESVTSSLNVVTEVSSFSKITGDI